jgi:4-amino-4-deoxychorismate lyase
MSRFIESIKIENQKLFLLDLHQKRVNDTLSNFGVQGSLDLAKIFKNIQLDENGFFKLRIVYDLEKNFHTQLIPYALPEIESFSLVEANQLSYAFKFENRKELDNLKANAKSGEIIIVKNNHITDTSFSNLLFYKNKSWYTSDTFLLNGVMRQHLLKSKKIKEHSITLQNISEFSHFKIINAMNEIEESFIYPIEKINNLTQGNEYLEI